MTTIGFLLDEHIPLVIRERLKQSVPVMRVFVIGDDDAPSKGTPDSDLLTWIAMHNCLLVTNNRSTMPVHLREHLADGLHIPGIAQLPRRMNVGAILNDLLLIWELGQPDEFRDQIIYLPL